MDKKTKATIINALRLINGRGIVKRECLNDAKSRDLVGKYKNGKDKYLNKYVCNKCNMKFKSDEVQVDHIAPVVDKSTGFIDWNTYMSRLFCDINNLQVLCKRCHKIKTKRGE